jgi:hypothetical protein
MNDNKMMIYLIAEIERQLTLVGATDFEVGRNQQPTNQYTGASEDDPIKTRVFLFSVTKSSDGHGRSYTTASHEDYPNWGFSIDDDNFLDGSFANEAMVFSRVDFQQRSKAIQISVAHYFDETDINARTPEDMCDLIHDLLDSPDAIKALRNNKIFVQEVGNIRPVFFTNGKDRFESLPNFDLQVNYSSSITKAVDYVNTANGVIERV